jgi:hypothetical protein
MTQKGHDIARSQQPESDNGRAGDRVNRVIDLAWDKPGRKVYVGSIRYDSISANDRAF